MNKIRLIRFLLLVLFLPIFSGCWDIREINDLGFVTAVGIDKAKPPNKYSVTVQIANAGSSAAKSEQGQTQTGVWIGTGEGKSLFAAIRNLIRISSRRVMWAHNNVIIIGESLAKESIAPVADFFTHNPELRMKTPVVVARGDAKDYILAKSGMETPSGLSFIYFRDYSSLLGESIHSNMLTISATLATRYVDSMIASVNLRKVEAPPQEGGKSSSEEKEVKTIDVSGAAVFKRDKMTGWLTPLETRGLTWITNEGDNIVVTIADPMHDNQGVAVETRGVRAKIISKVAGGMPRITIKVTGTGSIVEEDASSSRSLSAIKKQVEGLLNRKIAANIRSSLKKIQREYKCDVIGFATIIRAQHKREWEVRLKGQWKKIYSQMPVRVIVKVHVNKNTLKQLPAKID